MRTTTCARTAIQSDTALGAAVVGFVADGVQQVVKPDVGGGLHKTLLTVAQDQLDRKIPLPAPITNEIEKMWEKGGTEKLENKK